MENPSKMHQRSCKIHLTSNKNGPELMKMGPRGVFGAKSPGRAQDGQGTRPFGTLLAENDGPKDHVGTCGGAKTYQNTA